MIRAFIIGLFLFICALPCNAQVTVTKPEGLAGLIAGRSAQRKNPDATTKGYHILIFNGDSRPKAEGIKAKFDAEYSQYSEVVWDEPNFKVFVGLFISKFDCMRFYDSIKGKFQTTIVVNEKIHYQPIP
ncbi:MAG: hypothetical protein RLZZ60_870 [Bacteroidota bacterium]|jgi:hypothetical protein